MNLIITSLIIGKNQLICSFSFLFSIHLLQGTNFHTHTIQPIINRFTFQTKQKRKHLSQCRNTNSIDFYFSYLKEKGENKMYISTVQTL